MEIRRARIYCHEDGSLYLAIRWYTSSEDEIFEVRFRWGNLVFVNSNWFKRAMDDGKLTEIPDNTLSDEQRDDHCAYNNDSAYDRDDCICDSDYEERRSELAMYRNDNFDWDLPPDWMDDCPRDMDPHLWREFYTGG